MSRLQTTYRASIDYKRNKPKTIYAHAAFWLNPKTKSIHMTIPKEKGFHTTISNKVGSKRYHPNLYAKLNKRKKRIY